MLSSIAGSSIKRTSSLVLLTRRARPLSTSTADASINRLVISGRAWRKYANKNLPKKNTVKKENPDDKPWPKNVQIAGYVAGGIFIPYTIVWFVVSNPKLREFFQDYLPLEQLRTHFGEIEWDAQSYEDQRNDSLDSGFYNFPLEWSFEQRKTQAAVEKRGEEDLTANLYLIGDHELHQIKEVKASTRANQGALAEVMGVSSEDKLAVAVDFEEDPNAAEESLSTGSTEDFLPQDDPILHLRQDTHTFSSWYYFSNQNQQQQKGELKMSPTEVDVARMEYTISNLEKSLRDPTCTRDIDDMTTELKEAKRELSKLKWKRRLGMS